jgi:HAD superfamily hydrolase (TIGR01450 family)
MTNDPRGSRGEFVARLAEAGFDAIDAQVVTAGNALVTLVEEREGPGSAAFVIGSPSLKQELERVGVELLTGDLAREAGIVVVGGHEGFDFGELLVATQALRRGARLYGAGGDATFPMPDGPWPATGAILAAVETAGGAHATVVGKPEAYMFEMARRLLVDCAFVAVVGDNLDADIAGGKRAGLFTIHVQAGSTSERQLPDTVVQPDLIVPDLAALANAHAKARGAGR